MFVIRIVSVVFGGYAQAISNRNIGRTTRNMDGKKKIQLISNAIFQCSKSGSHHHGMLLGSRL